MKKLLAFMLMASAALHAQADKVKFTAVIKNPNSDSLVIKTRTFNKVIKTKKAGSFSDTFAVPADGFYSLFDGKEYGTMYLKNGFDLTLTMDAAQFDETIAYRGKGEKENNIVAKLNIGMERLQEKLATLSVADQTKEINQWVDGLATDLKAPGVDATFATSMKQELDGVKQQLTMMAEQAAAAAKMKGQPAPAFTYENHKGGTTSLSDLKGKYVYIDLWATWCGPCRQEIPFLQKVEEKFHDKKIAFVSLSIDAMKDHDKWKKFVTDKNLGGVQLMADKDWQSSFPKAFGVNSIPRFILIDPQGNVVDADAKRPSDPELTAQLETLLK
jgi:thiol-disulfide isomerase/thioredoxin